MTSSPLTRTTPSQRLGYSPRQLEGFRIGVTSDRRSEDLIDAFERRGAQVLHAPTLRMSNLRHDGSLIDETRSVIEQPPDVLLATTSYGIRRWFDVADAAGLGAELSSALATCSILVRGPKARGAIRGAGLDDAGMSAEETTDSLVAKSLSEFPRAGTVAIQLHAYSDDRQLERLRSAYPRVHPVTAYRWIDPDEDDDRVTRLTDAIIARALDIVVFTSAPAVDALIARAARDHRDAKLMAAFRSDVRTAAVGPVTAAPLRARGVNPVVPERHRLGALIHRVCETLEQHGSAHFATRYGSVRIRGNRVELPGSSVSLSPASLALFRALLEARGAVMSRADLARILPGAVDGHALEVAVSRLRRALGMGSIVSTVVKRGYRIDV